MGVTKSKSQIRTPAGGMNQDDSLITPSYNNAGHNSFQTGDYRYALNARIGSSRGDNFGDLEDIKDNSIITPYVVQQQVIENDKFNGSLAGWNQLDEDPGYKTWEYGSNSARLLLLSSGVTTSFISEAIYQTVPIPIANTAVKIIVNYTVIDGISNGLVDLVFLSGTAVITEVTIHDGDIITGSFNKTITIPSYCDGVGLRVFGTFTDFAIFDLQRFSLFTFVPGVQPSGTNKVIGKYQDNEFQRIYQAVYNSEGNHCLRYFDETKLTTYELIRWTGLKFKENYFVKMAKLDNWLSITDRNNPPRLIDTDNIANDFQTLGDENFREFHIAFHKWAPTVPPIPRVYYNNFTNNYEKLKNKVIHFSYRYIYYGNIKSRWSPISKGAVTTSCGFYYDTTQFLGKKITSIEVDIPGCLYDDPNSSSAYNYFEHTDIKFKTAVQYIELAFRDGELELWKLWKTIDVNNFTRYHYFDGDANLTPVALDDFNQPFDTVPFLAGTVEAVDNRFVFGDCLDELPPALGLKVTNVSAATAPDEDWDDSYPSSFPSLPSGPRDDLIRRNSLSFFNFKDRCIYKVGIQWLHRNGSRSAMYTNDDWMYNIKDVSIGSVNKLLAFNFNLSPQIPEWAVGYQIMRTNAIGISYFMYGIVNKFMPIIDDVSAILDQVQLPQEVKDRIQQHFDNERLVTAQDFSDEIDKQITAAAAQKQEKKSFLDSLVSSDSLFGWASGMVIEQSIYNEIKKGKDKRKKDKENNSIAQKLQQQLRKTKEVTLLTNASRIFIDINNWYFGAKKSGTVSAPTGEWPLNNLFYNYSNGDRIRFVGSTVANPTSASQLKEYDLPIIEFTGKGIIIEKPSDLQWIQSTTSVGGFYYYNIEVYSPKQSDQLDHLFFETGEWYPVLYPGTPTRVLAKSDFTYTSNAAVTVVSHGSFNFYNNLPFYYADCYKGDKTVYRDSITNFPPNSGINLSMSPDPNTTYGYWDRNNGRVSSAYRNIPVSKFKKTQVRFGGKIIEESFVNNLNNFIDADQFIYPSEYGRIRNLINTSNAQVESVGGILLAIGEREAWSIYVNRTTLEDLSGNTQVTVSDQVLGSYNSLLGSHGTLNPESVSSYRDNVYWWDAINGAWIRYGRDGLTPLSDYKMRNWFKEIGSFLINKYLTDELPTAISEFDPFNMELITYINHSSLPSTFRGYQVYKGAVFSEEDKRWKRCHTDSPEMYAKMNNQFYSFLGGDIYQHEAGPGYNTFYGVKQNVQWEPVFNDESEYKKSWQAFAEVSTQKWSIERILSEFRGVKTKQQTRISLDKFSEREDNFYSDIPRDINSTGVNPIIEGDRMRSKAIQVLMQLDPTVVSLSLLHYVYAICEDSSKNP